MSTGDDRVDASLQTALSQVIVETVASVEGVRPEELCPPEYEPLHAVIDPEALDTLFAPKYDDSPRSSGTVSFTYCGYRVTVDSDGSVELE